MVNGDVPRRIRSIGRQLRAWSLASIGVGVVLVVIGSGGVEAVGVQCIVWGAIDLAIAWLGLRDARRKDAAGVFATEEGRERERRRTERLLWINAGLDVGYVLVGAWLWMGEPNAVRMGHAVGVWIQGGFLLAFDVTHGVRLRAR